MRSHTAVRMKTECSADTMEFMLKSRRFRSLYGTLKTTPKVLKMYTKMMRNVIWGMSALTVLITPKSLFSGTVIEMDRNPIMEMTMVVNSVNDASSVPPPPEMAML